MIKRVPSLNDEAISELSEMLGLFSDVWSDDGSDTSGREPPRFYIWSVDTEVGPDRLCRSKWSVVHRERVQTLKGALSKDRRSQLLRIARGFDEDDCLWGMGLVTKDGEVYRVTINVPSDWTSGTDADRREKAGKIVWRPDALVAAMVWPD